jgi:hypothetical protein
VIAPGSFPNLRRNTDAEGDPRPDKKDPEYLALGRSDRRQGRQAKDGDERENDRPIRFQCFRPEIDSCGVANALRLGFVPGIECSGHVMPAEAEHPAGSSLRAISADRRHQVASKRQHFIHHFHRAAIGSE